MYKTWSTWSTWSTTEDTYMIHAILAKSGNRSAGSGSDHDLVIDWDLNF